MVVSVVACSSSGGGAASGRDAGRATHDANVPFVLPKFADAGACTVCAEAEACCIAAVHAGFCNAYAASTCLSNTGADRADYVHNCAAEVGAAGLTIPACK